MPKIGDIEGGYAIVYIGENLQIRQTPSGRFSIYDATLDKTLKSNISDMDNAKFYLEELEGTAGVGEEELAVELSGRGLKGFSDMLHKDKSAPIYQIGESYPKKKIPELTYLGGAPKYEVWMSPKERYTLTQRRPGLPSIDIKSGLSESDMAKILQMKDPEAGFQSQFESMPMRTSPSFESIHGSLSRQLEKEKALEGFEGY